MLRFVLLGCGRIGKRHAALLKQIDGAELSAVCDIIASRAEEFGKKYGIPYYTSMEKMVEGEKIDVVSICTPSGLHAEHCMYFAPHTGNIIVEKPMALRLDDAKAMIETCDDNHTRLFVVKQNRFNLPVLKLREAIEEGRFGKIYMATVRVHWQRPQKYYDMDEWHGTWAMDGGVLTNQASHHIDMLQWVLGPISDISAMTDTLLHQIEVEDTGVALLRAESGAFGVIEATTNTSPQDLEGSINVYGSKGTVEIGGFAMNKIVTWKFEEPQPEDKTIIEKFSVNPPDVYGFGHRAYLEHVLEAIQDERAALIDGAEGIKSLKIIHAIYESAETGRVISLGSDVSHSKLGRKK